MPGSVSDVGIVDIKEVELGETIELELRSELGREI